MAKSTREVDLRTRLALRPREAADALGISERTLRQLLPELPVVRRGGVVLLPVEPLMAWLRDQADIEGRRADSIAREVLCTMKLDAKADYE
jgi:excisionase family DNA binding protein